MGTHHIKDSGMGLVLMSLFALSRVLLHRSADPISSSHFSISYYVISTCATFKIVLAKAYWDNQRVGCSYEQFDWHLMHL